jgi:hypothetical protein
MRYQNWLHNQEDALLSQERALSPLSYAEMLDMPQLLYAKKLQAACVHLSYAEMLQHATTSIC